MRTPVHSALPTAPSVHWLPLAGGSKAARPLPPHSSSNLRDTTSKRSRSSPIESSNGRPTSPSTVRVQPSGSVLAGGNAVVANEVPRCRRHLVIQEVGRRFRVERPVVQQRQAVLAINEVRFSGQCFRHESGRHVPVKGNGGAQHRAHHQEAGSMQKPASVGLGDAAKHDTVRPVRVFRVQVQNAVCPAQRGGETRPRREAAAPACSQIYSPAWARTARAFCAHGALPLRGVPWRRSSPYCPFLAAIFVWRQV